MMKTTVTVLLRDFPKVKRAALSGERVVIETKQGNLLLTAERSDGKSLFGCMRERAEDHGVTAEPQTQTRWKPSL